MSIHPIHRPDVVYGQPELHIPYPAEPLNYPPYLNPDDDPDRESLTGEMKGDETSAEEKAMPVGPQIKCCCAVIVIVHRLC